MLVLKTWTATVGSLFFFYFLGKNIISYGVHCSISSWLVFPLLIWSSPRSLSKHHLQAQGFRRPQSVHTRHRQNEWMIKTLICGLQTLAFMGSPGCGGDHYSPVINGKAENHGSLEMSLHLTHKPRGSLETVTLIRNAVKGQPSIMLGELLAFHS